MTGTIVGVSGALAPRSRLLAAVTQTVRMAAGHDLSGAVVDFSAIEQSVRRARYRSQLDGETADLLRAMETATTLVMGVPLTGGTMDGLFKHLLDLADREALAGKPVLILADLAELENAPIARLHVRLVLEALGLSPVLEIVGIGRHAISPSGEMTDALREDLSVRFAHLLASAPLRRRATTLRLVERPRATEAAR